MTPAMRHNAWRIDTIVIAAQKKLAHTREHYLVDRQCRVADQRRKMHADKIVLAHPDIHSFCG
jgi:hypothetical protein